MSPSIALRLFISPSATKQRHCAGSNIVIKIAQCLCFVAEGEINNRKAEALRWLEQCYQDRAGADIGWIRVDSLVDPLRGDSRFEALAEKIVPAAEFKSTTAIK